MDKKLMPIAVSLLLFASCSTRKAELTYVADPSKTYQTIDNFGASDAWSMWTVGEMPQPTQERVARLLFSSADDAEGNPEGAGLSIWRYNIGAGSTEQGDSSYINRGTRTECFLNEDGTYNWDKQLGQRNFLKLAKNMACHISWVSSIPLRCITQRTDSPPTRAVTARLIYRRTGMTISRGLWPTSCKAWRSTTA